MQGSQAPFVKLRVASILISDPHARPYGKELRAAREALNKEALNKKVVECASRNWKIGSVRRPM
jgi:hypothetical protein